MNKVRRSEIANVCHGLLAQAIFALESVRMEEEMAYDNLPENFQDSEQGENMLDNIENLEDAIDKLEDAKILIEEAIEMLEDL